MVSGPSLYNLIEVKRTIGTPVEFTLNNFFESNENNCHIGTGIAYKLVEDDEHTDFTNNLFSIVNPNAKLGTAKLRFDNANYQGGEDIVFKIKYNTYYQPGGRGSFVPVYYRIIFRDQCPTQTIVLEDTSPYEIYAIPGMNYKVYSRTRPADDFSNQDVIQCPVEFSLVDKDLNPLGGAVANMVKINSKGWIEVDQSLYTGGFIDIKVKAISPFKDPVYKDVSIQQ